MAKAGRAIVCGASIGGLFAAAALLRRGWEVDLYERTEVELAGRGAGIVTHAELIEALTAVGAGTEDLGVAVQERVAFDRSGARVHAIPYPQIVTSWDRVHRLLRVLVPEGRHHLAKPLSQYVEDADGVTAVFADGTEARADLLVGTDGFRSTVRAQMQPAVQPAYAGYVVWRALANEADLPPDLHARLFGSFGFYLPTGDQVLGYPIAGQDNDLRPGHRRYNFVWYSPVPEADLQDMLTDATGRRHAVSIPPPLVREAVLARMEAAARERLAEPFVALLRQGERPFFTPIYDHLSPVMGAGRVALAGDAAAVARPHVGMGVTKAACDALALARQLDTADTIPAALAAYSAERVPAARAAVEQSRRLGALIFEGPPEGRNDDGRANPNLDRIMRQTAVATF